MFWEPLSSEVGHPNSQFSLLVVCLDIVCVCVCVCIYIKSKAQLSRSELSCQMFRVLN